MVIGITGGMGCGKSTVARLFEPHGFTRMDSDEVIRTQVLTDKAVIEKIVNRYGQGMLAENQSIHRGRLASVVFENDLEREWLENQLHPRLFAVWREAFGTYPRWSWVIEVPLLFEKQLENWFDFTLCVTTTAENQWVRLEKRGMTRAQAELRISKQLPLARKVELADFVIGNDGTTDFLRLQVERLVRRLAMPV